MNSIKEFLKREDVIKTIKILSYIINPLLTVFCILGIIIMIIGDFGVIAQESERKDKFLQRTINRGEYVEAYDSYYIERRIENVSGEEFQKYAEYYDFYDNLVMSRIKYRAGKTEESKYYSDAMQEIADTSESFEMKPIYDYLLSIDNNSFK